MQDAWWQRRPRNLYAIILLVVLILVSAMVLYTYTSFKDAATELILDRDQQLVVLSAARLREEITNLADNLEALSHNKEISDGSVHDRLLALRAASPRLAVYDAGVVILDHRGIVLASEPYRTDIQGDDWSDRVYFREVFTDTHLYVSDAVSDGPEDTLVVAVSVPLVGEKNQFTGALVGMFRLGEDTLSAFYASIVRLRIGQSGGTYVVDGNGQILFNTEADLIGHQITEEQKEMIDAGAGHGVALTEDNAGHQIVAAYAAVPGTTWTLFTEDDWDILTSSTQRYSRILLLSFAAALALPPLGLTILSRFKRFQIVEIDHPTREGFIFKRLKPMCFPRHLPMLPGWNLSQRIAQGERECGDFLFPWFQPDGGLSIAIGRIEVGGISGALTLASTRSSLKIAAQNGLGPDEALRQCNEVLCSEHQDPQKVHCLYLKLDPGSGKIEYANAGVPEPFLLDPADQIPSHLPGPPMGTVLDTEYAKGEVVVKPGQSLVIMSTELFDVFQPGNKQLHVEPIPSYQEGGYRRAEVLADAAMSKYQILAADEIHSTFSLQVFVLERVRSDHGDRL